MRFGTTSGAHLIGLHAHLITIEVDITRGLHSFTIVGLATRTVDESRDRIAAAIKNSGFQSPKHTNQKVIVSLAPADVRKDSAALDLPIAVAYLAACGIITEPLDTYVCAGELALDGSLRSIRGAINVAACASAHHKQCVFVPKENADEAALIDTISVYPASSLTEVLLHLTNKRRIERHLPPLLLKNNQPTASSRTHFDAIRGHATAKRALTIAAAGRHSVALYGPPGTGKTLLAHALVSLLPPLTSDQIQEVTAIHSITGHSHALVTEAPFRSPHHRTSYAALIGSAHTLLPGEISRAHHGVLFLDEFLEFHRDVIEALRQPLEEKVVRITSAGETCVFPADCICVIAFNPCPCGYRGHPHRPCTCTPRAIERYTKKLSGPIIDRIDMWIEVPYVPIEDLLPMHAPTIERCDTQPIPQIPPAADVQNMLSPDARTLLTTAAKTLVLSPRSVHRVMRLSHTIAGLVGSAHIQKEHLLEALSYRPKI